MPKFSKVSKERLAAAHPLLQKLMNEAIKHYDFTILQSQRGRADQERAYRQGTSGVHYGKSAHNWAPSVALDIAPYPVDWDDISRFRVLQQGIIKPLALKLGIPLRWGCNWDRDDNIAERGENDWPHIELYPWRTWAKKSKPYDG